MGAGAQGGGAVSSQHDARMAWHVQIDRCAGGRAPGRGSAAPPRCQRWCRSPARTRAAVAAGRPASPGRSVRGRPPPVRPRRARRRRAGSARAGARRAADGSARPCRGRAPRMGSAGRCRVAAAAAESPDFAPDCRRPRRHRAGHTGPRRRRGRPGAGTKMGTAVRTARAAEHFASAPHLPYTFSPASISPPPHLLPHPTPKSPPHLPRPR